jgi:outer membrane murein-binding lipoprotein Lpp
MSKRSTRIYSIAFVFLIILSGLSFGFLVGRSQQAKADQASEQVQLLNNQVKVSNVLVVKGANALRKLLVK